MKYDQWQKYVEGKNEHLYGQISSRPKARFLEFQKKKVTVSNFLHTSPKNHKD